MDRRKFLVSSVALAGALGLSSTARATTPNPSIMWVKLLVLDYHALAGDQDLSSLMPERDDVLPSLAAHARSRISEAGADIAVAERPTFGSLPQGVTELQIMCATVLLDLARLQHGSAEVVGGTLIRIFRPFPDDPMVDLLRPTAFFGAAARKESIAQEFDKTARGKLDQLVSAITLYK